MRKHTDGQRKHELEQSSDLQHPAELGAAAGSGDPDGRHAASSSKEDARADDVDEASAESFPASDPPAWAAMRVGPPRPQR